MAMLKYNIVNKLVLTIVIMIMFCGSLLAVDDAPPSVAAAMIIQVSGFDKSISGDVSIYVLGSTEMTSELEKAIGIRMGGGTLKTVTGGTDLPPSVPSVIVVSDLSKADDAISYAKTNKILSCTNLPKLVKKGVSLGIGLENDGPKILLNLASSKEAGCDWNPAILKIAQTVK
jgi:hypothetical protein